MADHTDTSGQDTGREAFDWAGQRIIVTGGSGFLGQHVVARLRGRGVSDENIFVPRSREFDLTTPEACERLYKEAFGPGAATMVLHLAAEVGGIGANRANPGRYFYANMAMALHLIEHARLDGFAQRGARFVQTGTICAYPNHTPVPFKEELLWAGYPEPTNAPYGVAKRAAWQMLDAYHAQYGLDSAYVLPVNLYGPHDNFDPETSHVIPALIRKCLEARDAGETSIEVWGTGAASREFLYVDDAAEGIVRAAATMTEPTPINLGTGAEITIRELVELIARLTGLAPEGSRLAEAIRWDASKPDGQPRRCLDTSRAAERLGWRAQVALEDGLRETIAWYESARGATESPTR